MTSALRWAAMRAILMFHQLRGAKSQKDSVHRPQRLKRKESRSGFGTEVHLLTSLTAYRYTRLKPAHGVWRWGTREIIYLSLHCHHQNDSCIKMGSDERHFNVLLIVRDKVTKRQCPQTTTFEDKGEPKRIRTEVPLLTSLMPYR